MMRKLFDEELEKLNVDLTKMGHLVEVAIENMIDAFKHQDKSLAKEIIANDRLINDMERTVESRAFNLILRQQPIATDLRNVNMLIRLLSIFRQWLKRLKLWFMKQLIHLLKKIYLLHV